jgi:hypothetical protein
VDEEAPLASEEDDEDWLAAEIATGLTFASSDAVMLTEAKGLHPMAQSIAVLVIVVLLLGFANGLDFASPEEGVVRPDEFVYAMSRAAPEDTAIFRGSVVDEQGDGLENVTVYVQWESGNQWVFAEAQTDAKGDYLMETSRPDWFGSICCSTVRTTPTCSLIGSCFRLQPCSSRTDSPPSDLISPLQIGLRPHPATTEPRRVKCEPSTTRPRRWNTR